jgi:hypothetical protein
LIKKPKFQQLSAWRFLHSSSPFSFRPFKEWFVSLGVLVVITAILEHPDAPKNIGGVQGLNPWNILFVFVFMGWLANKKWNLKWLGCQRAPISY